MKLFEYIVYVLAIAALGVAIWCCIEGYWPGAIACLLSSAALLLSAMSMHIREKVNANLDELLSVNRENRDKINELRKKEDKIKEVIFGLIDVMGSIIDVEKEKLDFEFNKLKERDR